MEKEKRLTRRMNKIFELKNIFVSNSFSEEERNDLYAKAMQLGENAKFF